MNCYFCQQPTISNVKDISNVKETANGYTPTYIEYTCSPCKAIYEYDCEHDAITAYWFSAGKYVAYFYPNSIQQFALVEPDPSHPGTYLDILVLRFIPNLTPTNLDEKVKLYRVLF